MINQVILMVNQYNQLQ